MLRVRLFLIGLGCLGLLVGASAVTQQNVRASRSAYIPGLTFQPQTYNNCGPASVAGVLGAYGVSLTQEEVSQVLRPTGTGYMRADVIDGYVRQFGLRAPLVVSGRIENIKAVIDLGVPVLVLQWLKGSGSGKDFVGEVPHFRTVRGYDDQAGVFWVNDPLIGEDAVISYKDFTTLWSVYDRWFIPIYPQNLTPRMEATLGIKMPR